MQPLPKCLQPRDLDPLIGWEIDENRLRRRSESSTRENEVEEVEEDE